MSTVACEVVARVHVEVGVEVSLVVVDDGAGDAGPGGADAQGAVHVHALDGLALEKENRKIDFENPRRKKTEKKK